MSEDIHIPIFRLVEYIKLFLFQSFEMKKVLSSACIMCITEFINLRVIAGSTSSSTRPLCPLWRCSCIPYPNGYELLCPAMHWKWSSLKSWVSFLWKLHVYRDVNDFSVPNGTNIGETNRLIILECPLPWMPLSRLAHERKTKGITDLKNIDPAVRGNFSTPDLFHSLFSVSSL